MIKPYNFGFIARRIYDFENLRKKNDDRRFDDGVICDITRMVDASQSNTFYRKSFMFRDFQIKSCILF